MSAIKTRFNFQEISLSSIILLTINTLQTLLALIIIGLVAPGAGTSSSGSGANYTIVVSVFTTITTPVLIYCVLSPPAKRTWLYVLAFWEFILGILWAAVAGVLSDNGAPGRVRGAFGLALVEMISLLCLSVMGCVGLCCAGRKIGRNKP